MTDDSPTPGVLASITRLPKVTQTKSRCVLSMKSFNQ